MADQSQPPTSGTGATASGLVISPEIQAKFGPLLDLIKGSESMNDEERQYWINILPVMTPEQIKNLEEILHNEKQQLAAIDAKYSQPAAAAQSQRSVESIGADIRSKKQEREQKEKEDAEQEGGTEEDLMQKIQSL